MSGIANYRRALQLRNTVPATNGKDPYHSNIQGTLTGAYEIGCFIGAIFALVYGERLGRRKCIILGSVVMILDTIIQVTVFGGKWELGQFIIGRMVTGVGNGANTNTIPVWQAECSKSHNRGLLICVEAETIAGGTLISYWLDFVFDNSSQWRFPIAFQISFAILLIFGVRTLPESRRWLLNHGREEEATRVIAALNGTNTSDPHTLAEKRVILEAIRSVSGAQENVTFKHVFTRGKGKHLGRTLIGASSQVAELTANLFTVLFENSIGLTRTMSLILGGVNATPAGRRKMFLWGTAGQTIAMVITFCILNSQNYTGSQRRSIWIVLVYCSPWVCPAELSPLKTRTRANATPNSTNWIFNYLIVQFLPIIYLFYPETAGRSLEELDAGFAKAYVGGESPVSVAETMPKMDDKQVECAAAELDIQDAARGDVERGKRVVRDEDRSRLDLDTVWKFAYTAFHGKASPRYSENGHRENPCPIQLVWAFSRSLLFSLCRGLL
ncbi:hypothetical protein L873DRAFT_1835584 [Choiromyces venosus 120613-1]|uniref:Major facilitator superfamily (MFS) profile domain-containing protein n=1 Tax=Choiromyces venosus 120613-1 TaxID=1336337 RepID=A0A3N4JLB8_9PEZI|nr:hypothetical protein L873DRAFT_1835584 [Choiromyces venosus 120613-1]